MTDDEIKLNPETDEFLDEIILGFGAKIAEQERLPNGSNLRQVIALVVNQRNEARRDRDAWKQRAEAAEAEGLEQARLNGMGSEREVRLIAERDAARAEAAKLRPIVERLAALPYCPECGQRQHTMHCGVGAALAASRAGE